MQIVSQPNKTDLKPHTSRRGEILTPCSQDKTAANEIKLIVTQCAMTLRGYGKEPEQLPTIVKMFIEVLRDYPLIRVQAAFRAYIRTKSETPTPAEIVSILEGENDEWKYIFGCLDHVKNGGSIEEWAQPRIIKHLGKNWRDYV